MLVSRVSVGREQCDRVISAVNLREGVCASHAPLPATWPRPRHVP